MLLHVTATYLIGTFYLLQNYCFNLYNGRNKSRTPHLFHGILSERVSLLCGFLIYVAALLFPKFQKLMVTNLKVKKNLKKIMLSSN